MTRTPLTGVHIRVKEDGRPLEGDKPLHPQVVETGDAVRLYVPTTDGSGSYGDVDLVGLLQAIAGALPHAFERAGLDVRRRPVP